MQTWWTLQESIGKWHKLPVSKMYLSLGPTQLASRIWVYVSHLSLDGSRGATDIPPLVAENGSGGFMSDLTFIGGAIGMRCKNIHYLKLLCVDSDSRHRWEPAIYHTQVRVLPMQNCNRYALGLGMDLEIPLYLRSGHRHQNERRLHRWLYITSRLIHVLDQCRNIYQHASG